jgi:membrane associated rhomboid family serine protease
MTESVAPPTCYRHSERETYVRCARCERPICPDCMISASVGFQCPECVAEGNDGTRQARTVAGGALVSNPGIVTRVLIGINVAVFVLDLLVSGGLAPDFGLWPIGVADGEYYRLVTSGFLHAGLMHIGFNMLALYWLGTPLEAMLGRWRYVLLYALSLLGGSVASYLFSPWNTLSVGASGAIFGLMGAFVVVAIKQKLDLRPFAVLIGLNLVIGFLPGFNIDWRAHLGGLVVGAALAAAMLLPPREKRRQVLWGSVAVLLVVLVSLAAYRTAELKDMFPGL